MHIMFVYIIYIYICIYIYHTYMHLLRKRTPFFQIDPITLADMDFNKP